MNYRGIKFVTCPYCKAVIPIPDLLEKLDKILWQEHTHMCSLECPHCHKKSRKLYYACIKIKNM